MDPRHFFAVTTPAFGEWITYGTGVVLPVISPVCLYTEATYFPKRDNDILLLRTVSLFWDSMCILNYFSARAAEAAGEVGQENVLPLRFVESTHLSAEER